MPENTQKGAMESHLQSLPKPQLHRTRRHRGRIMQIRIYLVKLLRLFFYQSDWKVLPMSMLVAGIVSIVIRPTMFVTMEGTRLGAFAIACVALWNGCFNSIQSICRERDVIKREHRSGMHISSYVISHVLYQAILCLVQTTLTMFIFARIGIKIPAEGVFFGSMAADLCVSIFLITFAADMLSLLISSLVHSTTAAMTFMPFILIFQLVFSGAVFSLPKWGSIATTFTISSSGMKCVAAQAGYNELPMVTGWNALFKMRKEPVDITVTVGQILDLLSREDINSIAELRAAIVIEDMTAGNLFDALRKDPNMDETRQQPVHISTTVGDLIDMVGEEEVRNTIMSRSASASQEAAYVKSKANIASHWLTLIVHSLVYICISILLLEFIDKDKR